MDGWIFLAAVLFLIAFLAILLKPATRYPDGRCYLCRRGKCWPGDTCDKCNTEQPV